MLPIEFCIPIRPIAKGRPRFGNGRIYTPTETVLFESALVALSRKYKPLDPLEMPLDVDIECHFIKPRTSKKLFHVVKPDATNLVKSIEDAFNKVFWVDDSQIVRLRVTKYYSEKEHIRVLIKEFSEESI